MEKIVEKIESIKKDKRFDELLASSLSASGTLDDYAVSKQSVVEATRIHINRKVLREYARLLPSN